MSRLTMQDRKLRDRKIQDLKIQDLKMQDLKMHDESAGVEIQDRKCGTNFSSLHELNCKKHKCAVYHCITFVISSAAVW